MERVGTRGQGDLEDTLQRTEDQRKGTETRERSWRAWTELRDRRKKGRKGRQGRKIKTHGGEVEGNSREVGNQRRGRN